MDIESKVRERIEALLVNYARNQNELRALSPDDGSIETDAFEEERDLYHRIINNYRNALAEVNSLLDEQVGYLSGFYHVVRAIEGKRSLQEICAGIVQCTLDHFGAEYCCLLLPRDPALRDDVPWLEGLTDGQKFLHFQSSGNLLGSKELEQAVAGLTAETREPILVEDLYVDARFQGIDLPVVVRSLVCLPMGLSSSARGYLLLTHSRPRFFNGGHLRVLRILGSVLLQLILLTSGAETVSRAPLLPPQNDQSQGGAAAGCSLIMLELECKDNFGRFAKAPHDVVRSLRNALKPALLPKESIFSHEENGLLILLPGATAAELPGRAAALQRALTGWRESQGGKYRAFSVDVGCTTCEEGADLLRCLQMSSHLMHPGGDEEDTVQAASK